MVRLGVNIDHIATLRNARNEHFPDVVEAGLVVENSGAELITVHLREDRRHIRDNDVIELKKKLKIQLNLEMALTREMMDFALNVKPDFICLVPEKRHELTTEGGLNVIGHIEEIKSAIKIFHNKGIKVSLFVDPDEKQILAAKEVLAYSIEIHTGAYAQISNNYELSKEFKQIKQASELAHSLGLVVNSGHGLNYENVKPIANLANMHELNIGFAIVARSIFYGLSDSVIQMKKLING